MGLFQSVLLSGARSLLAEVLALMLLQAHASQSHCSVTPAGGECMRGGPDDSVRRCSQSPSVWVPTTLIAASPTISLQLLLPKGATSLMDIVSTL